MTDTLHRMHLRHSGARRRWSVDAMQLRVSAVTHSFACAARVCSGCSLSKRAVVNSKNRYGCAATGPRALPLRILELCIGHSRARSCAIR
jgi:hypothetical protein